MSLYKMWANTLIDKNGKLITKRVERFIIFTLTGLATILYVAWTTFKCELSPTDFMLIISIWLGYGGFMTIQNRIDKKTINKDEQLN